MRRKLIKQGYIKKSDTIISMLIVLVIVSLFVMVISLSDARPSKQVYPDIITGVVFVRNYDGDTITVNIDGYPKLIGYHIPIRVRGVDTPERRGSCVNEKAWAIMAKYFVYDELSKAEHIKLLNPGRGKYFRILADVVYDGKLLSEELISNGYAYVYDGGTKQNPWCDNKTLDNEIQVK